MDLFSTNTLTAVVDSLIRPPSFFLDRYFPTIETSETEEIHFDVTDAEERLAPFVSPLVEGKTVESQGFNTKTFKPAYIKDKVAFDPFSPLKRRAGEAIDAELIATLRLVDLGGAEWAQADDALRASRQRATNH
ncbi:MAG: major capsid protein, partial [Anaerolineae bacterium]